MQDFFQTYVDALRDCSQTVDGELKDSLEKLRAAVRQKHPGMDEAAVAAAGTFVRLATPDDLPLLEDTAPRLTSRQRRIRRAFTFFPERVGPLPPRQPTGNPLFCVHVSRTYGVGNPLSYLPYFGGVDIPH